MSVYIRGKIYWCRFMLEGTLYRISTGFTTEREAKRWEREKIAELKQAGSPEKIYQKIQANLAKNKATFQEAFDFFGNYPRKRMPIQKVMEQHKSYWFDFAAFAVDHGAEMVSDVTAELAMKYLSRLREEGRYTPISYERNGKTIVNEKTIKRLSTKTYNAYLVSLKLIFRVLTKKEFCTADPFAEFEKMTVIQVNRVTFPSEELRSMRRHTSHRAYPIIMLGGYAGLRIVDICYLQARNVHVGESWLRGVQYKTKKPYNIPIHPALLLYLKSQIDPSISPGDYVFPELAALYKNRPSEVSKLFADLMRVAGVKGTSIVAHNRQRASSLKGAHSLRHTFGAWYVRYLPKIYVKALLGHADEDVTDNYTNHVDEIDLYRRFLEAPAPFTYRQEQKKLDSGRIAKVLQMLSPQNIDRFKRRLLRII